MAFDRVTTTLQQMSYNSLPRDLFQEQPNYKSSQEKFLFDLIYYLRKKLTE